MNIATNELIEKLAKNLAKARIASELVGIIYKTVGDDDMRKDVIDKFEEAMNDIWTGTDDYDEEQRRSYRLEAIAVLISMGFTLNDDVIVDKDSMELMNITGSVLV